MSDDNKHSDQFLLKNSIEIKNQTKKINRKINEQKSSQIFFFFFDQKNIRIGYYHPKCVCLCVYVGM